MKTTLLIPLLIIFTNVNFGQSKNDNQTADSKPFLLGEIVEIKSMVLNEKRMVNIYLSVGYNSKDSVAYPVIICLTDQPMKTLYILLGSYNSIVLNGFQKEHSDIW